MTESRAVPARGWLVLCALLAAGSFAASMLPSALLDWQPGLVWPQPWRLLSAAFVHWSPRHLAVNLLALALVAALGWRLALGAAQAAAWACAWPLTHAALSLQPWLTTMLAGGGGDALPAALEHYGGLSGVLHAGVAVAALAACRRGGRERVIGLLLFAGLLVKVISEAPWGAPLRASPSVDVPVAPFAHAAGMCCGVICAGLTARLSRSGR